MCPGINYFSSFCRPLLLVALARTLSSLFPRFATTPFAVVAVTMTVTVLRPFQPNAAPCCGACVRSASTSWQACQSGVTGKGQLPYKMGTGQLPCGASDAVQQAKSSGHAVLLMQRDRLPCCASEPAPQAQVSALLCF